MISLDRRRFRDSPSQAHFLLMPGSGVAVLILLGAYCIGCHSSREPAITPTSENGSSTNGFRVKHLQVPGGDIDLLISYEKFPVSDESIVKWVQTAASAVSTYFGKYPLRHVAITVTLDSKGKLGEGVTTPEGIYVKIGPNARQADLKQDWVMTHEMFHLAFPDMDDQYLWLQEGLASYLEPLARVRIGDLTPEKVWGDLVEGLPQGEPEAGDQGLDRTHTWGRTYWGGSMFCLLADLRIREQTHDRRSIDDAMRAILDQGGDHLHHWTLERVMEVGDQATGTHVLHDLHEEMGNRPVQVDLNDLWRRLGVESHNGKLTFVDTAPLAAIRKSMTAPAASK